MRRSPIEMEVATLETLYLHKALKLTHIMYKTNVNCVVLKEILERLMGKGLIKISDHNHDKMLKGNRIYYSLTQDGLDALKAYGTLLEKMKWTEEQRLFLPH